MHLPNTPKTFLELLGLSIRHHFSAFRKMLMLIVFLVVVKDAYIYLGGFPDNPYLSALVAIVMGVLILYLITAMLYQVNCLYSGETITWRHALSDVRGRFAKVFLAVLIFIVVPAVLFALAHWVAEMIVADEAKRSMYAGLILVLVVGIPVMVAYLYYFFTVPNIVMDDVPLGNAFRKAPLLVGQEWRDLVRVFGVYTCAIAVWIIVSPDTLHGHLMKMYKISALFDFVAFSVTLPIMMNLIVLMRNDLRLRREIDSD